MPDPIYRDRVTYRLGDALSAPLVGDYFQDNAVGATPQYWQVNAAANPTPDYFLVSAA